MFGLRVLGITCAVTMIFRAESERLVRTGSIGDKFRTGELIVHMKRSFEDPSRGLRRWQEQGHIDDGLSYSLIHPQMALQKLWVKPGYLFDASQCEVLAGSTNDLWVNNMIADGAQNTLSSAEGRRAELMRLIWVSEHNERSPKIHAIPPVGFEEWATNPDSWTGFEREVFTASENKVIVHPIKTVPKAEELKDLFKALHRNASSKVRLADDLHGMASGVVRDYTFVSARSHIKERFTEVLAKCSLDALLGFVYSVQDVSSSEERERLRSQYQQKGREVLNAIRSTIHGLRDEPLVVAEYAPTTPPDSDFPFVEPADMDKFKEGIEAGIFVEWKPDYEATLTATVVSSRSNTLDSGLYGTRSADQN